jgi:hypothetical protein
VSRRVRHILSLSGGKDSTALAIYMRGRIPEMEYVFCDTEKELPETYDYLKRLEAYLGRPIVVLKHDGRDFDHHLALRRGYLPSHRVRWCTELLKIRPFEAYVGDDEITSYIGIRADEDRLGYISRRPNIAARYPFKEDGIVKDDVMSILAKGGLGLPDYHRWRSRSGCYFCFFQQLIEWVGLLENHPELFAAAMAYEKDDPSDGRRFTWNPDQSLREMSRPQRIAAIKSEHARRMQEIRRTAPNTSLLELYEDDGDQLPCVICRL